VIAIVRRHAAPAVLAAVLTFPIAPAAEEASGGTPAKTPPDSGRCDAAQMAVVDEAFATARERVRRAIEHLDESPPEDPHVRRWFGATPRKILRHHFELIAAGLQDDGRPRLRCNDGRSCTDGRMAYARVQQRLIGFCATFFRAGAKGQDTRFGVLVHEVSHIAVGTRDAAYQPRGAQALAKQEPRVAAMNADSYEYFVEFLPR
jgi:hypothetical protein